MHTSFNACGLADEQKTVTSTTNITISVFFCTTIGFFTAAYFVCLFINALACIVCCCFLPTKHLKKCSLPKRICCNEFLANDEIRNESKPTNHQRSLTRTKYTVTNIQLNCRLLLTDRPFLRSEKESPKYLCLNFFHSIKSSLATL